MNDLLTPEQQFEKLQLDDDPWCALFAGLARDEGVRTAEEVSEMLQEYGLDDELADHAAINGCWALDQVQRVLHYVAKGLDA